MYYNKPSKPNRIEQIIKKSRFICYLQYCESPSHANELVTILSKKHPDAHHICWAYVCGVPGNYSDYGFNDDGEPSGTAGKPMFNVLQHNPVSDICAVVIRYFGGVKLGTAGLIRAYSSSVSRALQTSVLEVVIQKENVELTLPYSLEDRIRHVLNGQRGEIKKVNYSEQVKLICEIPKSEKLHLISLIEDIGKGSIDIT